MKACMSSFTVRNWLMFKHMMRYKIFRKDRGYMLLYNRRVHSEIEQKSVHASVKKFI